MASANEVQVHAADALLAASAAQAAIDEVLRIERKYSRYRADSVVSRINAAAGGDAMEIDAETAALLDYADACWRESGGTFDATSGVLRRAWRFDVPRVPAASELAALVALIGWDRIEREANRIRLPVAGMELDFGGFGKEYAVDRAAATLRQAGVAGALVNLAGDLMVTGPAPDGSPWRVGIRHPRLDGHLVATVELHSGALATSGDYERAFVRDGVRYCHLLDPRTGRPVAGMRSVTVLAPTCLVAGSATTIALLQPEAGGLAWLRGLGLRFLAVASDGSLVDATGIASPAC